MKLTLKVIDKDNTVLYENSGEDFIDLVCKRVYQEGDKIILETSEKMYISIGRMMR